MSSKRYPEEFKIEAVKQVTEKGHSVADVAARLGTTNHSLYAWVKRYAPNSSQYQAQSDESAEIRRLKKELLRVTEERDILKKAVVLRKPVRQRYAFIKANQTIWSVRRMCKVFGIHPSDYYSWPKNPDSRQEKRRKYLLGLIKQFWLESGCVYGYRKIYSYLRDEGEICGINQVHSLMKREGIQSQRGYRKPRPKGGAENIIVPNKLSREFNPIAPNQSWVTNITYISYPRRLAVFGGSCRSILSASNWLVNEK